jgi:shikimate kinase/protein tyrosine phosphatase (PTP) superfamily phosphohydrolase (DUF442 family)
MTADFDLQNLNVYLIGMMGCGKSTTGNLLAQKLGYRFFDTDKVITQATGLTVSQIFAEAGEAEFRKVETQVLSQLSAYTRLVVATGGGIVLERMNWSHMQQGLVIWLEVEPETLLNRLKEDTTRPLLQNADPQQTLRILLAQRSHLYAQADIKVHAEEQDLPEAIVSAIVSKIPHVLRHKPFMMTGIQDILNYRYISDKLATSGQPTAEEFALIHRAGYRTVLNLAPANASNALPNEQAIVASLGMDYINIAVVWENPTMEDFSRFCAVMNTRKEQPIFVHCAMNMRVSAFVYLYRYLILGMPLPEAYEAMAEIWQPNETWQKFIETVIVFYRK